MAGRGPNAQGTPTLGRGLGEAGRPVRRAEDRLNALHPRKGGACSTRRNMVAPSIPRDEAAAGGRRARQAEVGAAVLRVAATAGVPGQLPRCRTAPVCQRPLPGIPPNGQEENTGRHRERRLPQRRRRTTRCFPLRTTQSPGSQAAGGENQLKPRAGAGHA